MHHTYPLATALFATLIAVSPGGAEPVGPSHTALAEHWAPLIYHDTAANYLPTARDDYMTRFDFDGNWEALDNRENMESGIFPLLAYVYYAVIETETHYFITYAFYHPFDSSVFDPPSRQSLCIQHENDMEGVILTIRKDGPPDGSFRVIATEAHGRVFYYKPVGSDVVLGDAHRDPATSGGVGPDSTAYFPNPTDRVAVFIEANGHGVGGRHRAMEPSSQGVVYLGGDLYGFLGGDGIAYYYDGGPAEVPTGAAVEAVRYELLPMTELWSRRFDFGDGGPYCASSDFVGSRGCRLDDLAVSFGGLCWPFGGSCAANPPWGWDSDAASSPVGEWFLDPAYVVAELHVADLPERDLPGFDQYVSNPFLSGDKSLAVTYPRSGYFWAIGVGGLTTWVYSDTGQGPALDDSVRIDLSRDGGASWETIADRIPITDGSYVWEVTGPESHQCYVRVIAGTDCVLDVIGSAGPFHIGPDLIAAPDPGVVNRVNPPRPNPFVGVTRLTFEMERAAPVRLELFDAAGHLVRTLAGGTVLAAGPHAYEWDGTDQASRTVPAGNYFFRLQLGAAIHTGRLVLVR